MIRHIGPLVFSEIFKSKPWGGRALARVAGKKLPPGERIGESWELADHPHGTSVVAEGPLAGLTLRELLTRYGALLLGRNARGRRFPLLIKLLDVRVPLSIQVHPDDRCARKMKLSDSGKTEAWYVIESLPNGRLSGGLRLRRGVRQLRSLAESGQVARRLKAAHPRRGQAWLCPAGCAHGLGPGLVLFEVQQNSDATFRIYDWGRLVDGHPRELHLDEAVQAMEGRALTLHKARPRLLARKPFAMTRLLACDKFVLDRWQISRPAYRLKPRRFEIIHVLGGRGTLRNGQWPEVAMFKGRTALIPACVAEYEIRPESLLKLLRVAEPE